MEDLEWEMDHLYHVGYESGYEQAMIDRIGIIRFEELEPTPSNIN